ncbi:class I adenylate-forming enzyme family protein [Paenibacillus massiliensis]|uniref:class I adenylate-forming enzyme family protein n=1 Tax=Paenibacillus massiliensis TaxID=225917 RepID=UPI0004716198|nr:class I adenylate-forming enzyme family protein [Paenibacillus massiliensis]
MPVTQMHGQIITSQKLIDQAEFQRDVLGFSHLMHINGIHEESRVILKAENSYWFIVSLFSLCQLAASVTVVDEQIQTDELENIYHEVEACCIVTDHELALPQVNTLLFSTLQEELELYQYLYGKDRSFLINLDSWMLKNDALILYSSGTTGKPKGIVKSGRSFIDNIKLSVQAMAYKSDDCLLPVVPYSHFYGISLIFSWWFTQCSILICKPKNLWSVITWLDQDKATVIDANPSAYYMILRMLERKPELLERLKQSPVRMWCVGGSPLTNDLEKSFMDIVGQPLLNGYGLSELGNVSMGTLASPMGCGRLLPGVEARIETRNPVDELEQGIGEIWIRTPGCMEGYLHQPDLTQEVLQDGWFKTGDLGFLKEEMLYVIGRAGKSVTRMGYTFSPVYIENQISRLGYRSCVIALDDERKGASLIVFVERNDGQEHSSLRKDINRLLPTYMYPDTLLVVDSFPLNRNGKVDRLELERLAYQRTIHEVG